MQRRGVQDKTQSPSNHVLLSPIHFPSDGKKETLRKFAWFMSLDVGKNVQVSSTTWAGVVVTSGWMGLIDGSVVRWVGRWVFRLLGEGFILAENLESSC